jgi:papilin
MYRYDEATQKCVRFIYGGCGGTDNRFGTIKECIDTCGATNVLSPPAKCLQPARVGRCFAAFQKFYYNSSEKACKEFVYGGCDGNENNFETLEECKTECEVYENEVKNNF